MIVGDLPGPVDPIPTVGKGRGEALAAVAAWAVAADQGLKLYQELNREITYAPGTSEEEKKRLSGMTREEKQAKFAASLNRGELERRGVQTSDTVYAGPLAPGVAQATDPRELIKLNEQQVKYLSGELKVRIVNVDEINAASGDKSPPLDDAGVNKLAPAYLRGRRCGSPKLRRSTSQPIRLAYRQPPTATPFTSLGPSTC